MNPSGSSAGTASGQTEPADISWLLGAYDVHRATPQARPWVLIDMVTSVDGRTALGGRVGDLSTQADQMLFQHLRGLSDAVLVGAETVRAEKYGPVRCSPAQQASRAERAQAPQPRLCIVSRSLDFDPKSRVFDEGGPLPVIFTCDSSPAEKRAELSAVAHIELVGENSVDLRAAMGILRSWGVELVVCEGGASINSELVDQGLFDELSLTISPILGGDPIGLLASRPHQNLPMRLVLSHAVAGAVFLRYVVGN
jgi:riboflavin-specific deaminase-like protein